MTQTPESDSEPSPDGPALPVAETPADAAPATSAPVSDSVTISESVTISVSATSAAGETSTSAVEDVLAQVRERGFITTGEIFAAFPDLEPDADELRELWEMFESRGIKVLDEIAEELKLEDERRGSSPVAPPAPTPPVRRAEHRPNPT